MTSAIPPDPFQILLGKMVRRCPAEVRNLLRQSSVAILLSCAGGLNEAEEGAQYTAALRRKIDELIALVLQTENPGEAATYACTFLTKQLEFTFELLFSRHRARTLLGLGSEQPLLQENSSPIITVPVDPKKTSISREE